MPRKGRPPAPLRYETREVTEDDFTLLEQWVHQPHWQEWWGPAEQELAQIHDHMDSVSVEPLIVELDGEPIAYVQVYDPHLEDGHPYADQPFGTLGIDLSIGPAALLGQGHGSAILGHVCDMLFSEGAPRLIIDPSPHNTRAVAAYRKAGFEPIGERVTEYGYVLMMARDAPDEDHDE